MGKLRFLFAIVFVCQCIGCTRLEVSPVSTPTTSGIKFYGEEVGNILKSFEGTQDGGYVFGGYTNTSAIHPSKGFIQKCDKDGNIEWYKYYGGSFQNQFNVVHATSDGGYIAAGSTNSFGNGIVRQDFYKDAYLVKTDANGDIKWQKPYGNVKDDGFYDVAETPDHGFVAVGILNDPIYNNCTYVVKTDQKLDTLWTRVLYKGFYKSLGTSVAVQPNGNIGIAGYVVKSDFAIDQDTDYSAFILLSADGKDLDYQNAASPYPEYKNWGSVINVFDFYVRTEKIIYRPDGFIFAVNLYPAPFSVMLFKVGFTGNVIWHHPYFGLGGAFLNDAVNNAEGGLLISGGTTDARGNSYCWLLNTDPNGNKLWETNVSTGINTSVAAGAAPSVNSSGVGVFLITPQAKHANFFGFLNVDQNGKIIENK